MAFLRSHYPAVPQPTIIPYHYLSVCALHSTRIPLPDLKPASPYFVHPDRARDHAPLRAWVSVNVHRHEGESAEEARINVVSALETGGALSVNKRAHADILIVDTSSQFYNTVKAEKESFGRDWQRLEERSWVEACAKKGTLLWRTVKDEVEAESSFDEEPMGVGNGKGPGRPTGK